MRYAVFWVGIALIGLLHFYIGSRLLPAMPLSEAGRAIGALLLTLNALLLPAGLFTRRLKSPGLKRLFIWTSLLLMGWGSSLLVLTVLRDAVLGLASLSSDLLPATFDASTFDVSTFDGTDFATDTATAVPFLALILTVIGFINARKRARIVDVDVPIDNLPDALHGFTIAQISDIHVGPTIKHDYLDRIVDAVNALEPHVIAITGDLVDGSVKSLAAHTKPLKRLKARHGSYFVTGNHEYYSGAHAWIDELKQLGLKVLLNEHVLLTHGEARLVLAGVTDYTAHHFDPSHRSCPHTALAGAPADVGARVLLAHQPRSAAAAASAGFDLQLSGHTHGGQFLPWNFFVRLQQPFTAGLNRLNTLWVYTSRGTGYWGPPKRLGAPSEITRLRLVRR